MNKTTPANRAYRNLVSANDLPLMSERFREGKLPSVFVHFRMSRDWTKMQILDCKGFVSDYIRPGKTWLQQFIHPDDQPQVNKIIKRAIRTKRMFILEHRMRRPDGTLAWFFSRAAPVLDQDGRVAEWRGATSDASESVEAVDALAAEEAKYRAVVETSTDGFWMTDWEGRIRMVNNAYAQRSGYSREELLRMTVADLEARESRQDVQAHIEMVIRNGHDRFETEHRTKDGEVWPVEISAAYLAVGDGLFFVFSRDLTERRALEKKIIEAASSEQERLGRELHDNIGQQLTGIAMLASSALRRLKAAGRNKEADIVADLTQHIQTVIGEVGALSDGLVPVELDARNLGSALSRLTVQTTKTSGVDCRYRGLHTVDVEGASTATHLYRIAQEAIHNAIKHGKPKRIDVSLERVQSHLVLTVRDDGDGMHDTKDHQRGLGLRIMSYRCSSIGGRLRIKRASEGGTLVSCRVPLGH